MDEDDDANHQYTIRSSSEEAYKRGNVRGEHVLYSDEPDFLPVEGEDAHPAPVDYLVFGLLACQASVLTQCFEKARIADYEIDASAAIRDMRTDDMPDAMPDHTANRIEHIDIGIDVTVPENERARAERCLSVYDDGCVVGQSLRAGIEYTPRTSLATTEPAEE